MDLTYKVKCRNCNKIEKMYFGTTDKTDKKDFETWAYQHSSFPVQKQCSCDNGSMMFHDLISYAIIL